MLLSFVSFISYSLPYYNFSPKGELIIFEDTKSIVTNDFAYTLKFDNSPCGEYQLHQHKGKCYRQVAPHPMTACLGGANVLRKQELRLCCAVIAPIICFYTY